MSTQKSEGGLFDPGLQPERTALAWLRTALVLTVGSLVGLRVLPHYWGPFGLVLAGTGALASMALIGLAVRRYRLTGRRLTAAGPAAGAVPDGRLPALLALLTVCAATIAAVLVVWVAAV
ncbi:DUF202 domain-containing protein [Nakamurella flava]|uniref:DUF202 domain-containing protein n=1 Tax=Nakamurella flava TaxID=2576308 RepID=A0A4U6QJ87_9ACTN|nr:DUF202 domain-containing protein [Nakamurella flava]TKV60341.1 DUF202 domain-containing protein [Nakamurella flava]